MDYSIGSVAALISGNITPNRPRSLKRALTPTKHQPSPNVTPKSEFVDDRSIFLSPSVQKKKAIIKKSPKRIFQAPDLDVTNDGEGIAVLSPKADKVKKHLKDELEATTKSALTTKSPKSPKKKNNKSVEMKSPKKQFNLGNVETSDVVVASGDCTPTKSPKKNKLNKSMEIKSKKELNLGNNNETRNVGETDNVNNDKSPKKKKHIQSPQKQVSLGNDETNNVVMASGDCTPNKKQKKNRKSICDVKESTDVEETGNASKNKSPKKKLLPEGDNLEKKDSVQIQVTSEGPKKNKKKRKKSKAKQSISVTKNESTENAPDKTDVSTEAVINQSPQKVNKKKNKRKKKQEQAQNKNTENEAAEIDNQNQAETKQTKKKKSTVNPNAITDKDSDSEHESDDEIESEDEHNTKILDTGSAESSDEEEEVSKPKKAKLDTGKEPSDVKTQDEVKRTIFVGNVPFSKKCKKDVKKIFSQHGEIETVRIRTIPVKDARVTPKLAIIKNELHPDRSTVNVYIRFKHPSSVEKALAENNTVLNEHHLRVTRSDNTGADHDPKCTVFVGNVPFAMEDEALRAKFENCGEIDSVRIVRDKKTNAGKGFGYVNFASKDGVELALAMSEEDLTVKNRILRVKRCTDTNKKDKHGAGTGEKQVQRPHGRGGSVNRGGSFSRGGSSDRGNFRGRGGSSDRGNFSGRGGRGARGGNSDRGHFSGRGARGGGSFNRGGGSSRGGGNFSRGGGNFGRGRGNFARGGGRFQGSRGGGGGFQGGNERSEGQMGFRGSEDPALRRIMNKRQNQDNSDGPPNKKARDTTQPKEKKARKEFVGMTAEKKKQKRKFDKGQKQKKALSEILTK